jgi:hypothetical protein
VGFFNLTNNNVITFKKTAEKEERDGFKIITLRG